MPKNQKGVYCAVVYGGLIPDADGSYRIEPQGKRDFQLTHTRAMEMFSTKGKEEFLAQAEQAWEALHADVKNGGLQF